MTITRTTESPDKKYSLRKGERLSGHRRISSLFESGLRADSFPLRLIFAKVAQEEYPVVMAVVVPKRLIRNAATRNLIKRRIREVYRSNKPEFPPKAESLHLLIQYRSEKTCDYPTIERAYLKAVKSMEGKLGFKVT